MIGRGVAKAVGAVQSIGIEQQRCMRGFVRMCTDGWDQGWHERNGGNASYRMTPEDVAACEPFFADEPGAWQPLAVSVPALAGAHFVVTRTGGFMHNLARDMAAGAGIVEIDAAGAAYRVVWGLSDGGAPTSEFSGHLVMHQVRMAASDGADRVIYHCHPVDVVALTCAVAPDDRAVTRTLWKMMTECIMVFPEGVGVVGCLVPGSLALAQASACKMRDVSAVVWAHHGLVVSGETFDAAFGLAHVIVKAAAMYRSACAMCGAAPFPHEVTDADLRAIADELGLAVREGYLDA